MESIKELNKVINKLLASDDLTSVLLAKDLTGIRDNLKKELEGIEQEPKQAERERPTINEIASALNLRK